MKKKTFCLNNYKLIVKIFFLKVREEKLREFNWLFIVKFKRRWNNYYKWKLIDTQNKFPGTRRTLQHSRHHYTHGKLT